MRFHALAAASLMLLLSATPGQAATFVVQFGGTLLNGGPTFSGQFNIDDTVPAASDEYHHNAIHDFIVQSSGFESEFGDTTVKFSQGDILVRGDNTNPGFNTLAYRAYEDFKGQGMIYFYFPGGSFANANIPTTLPDFSTSMLRGFVLQHGDTAIRGTVTSLSLAPAGVPEPTHWALLIGGLGLAGGFLRWRGASQPEMRGATRAA